MIFVRSHPPVGSGLKLLPYTFVTLFSCRGHVYHVLNIQAVVSVGDLSFVVSWPVFTVFKCILLFSNLKGNMFVLYTCSSVVIFFFFFR